MLVKNIKILEKVFFQCYYTPLKMDIMKLYHIHRDNKYNDIYFEGNTFKVGDKPNNLRKKFKVN